MPTPFWTQLTFPGSTGANLSTVVPSFPASGASYTYISGSGIVVDTNYYYNSGGVSFVQYSGISTSGTVWQNDIDCWFASWNGTPHGEYFKVGNSSSAAYAFYIQSDASSWTVQLYKDGVGSPLATATQAFTPSATANLATMSIRMKVDTTTSGHTVLTLYLSINGGTFTQKFTYDDSSSPFGFAFSGFYSADANPGVRFTNMRITDGTTTTPLGVDNLGDVVPTGALSAQVPCRTPVGGTGGPYTFQWYSSTTANFTLGAPTLISGATSQTLTLTGLTANSNLWVACRVSDGTTTLDTYKRLVRVSGQRPIIYVAIGDSTNVTSGGSSTLTAKFAPSHVAYALRSRYGLRQVILLNQSVAGTATADWQAGGSNMNTALAAAAAALAANPTAIVVFGVRLGANDAQGSVSSGTFTTRYANMLGAITGAGYLAEVSYPTWREPGDDLEAPGTPFDEAYTPLVLSYVPIIDASINHTNVFPGDLQHLWLSASQPGLHGDNSTAHPGFIHPSDIGAEVMGIGEANGVMAITNPPPAAGWFRRMFSRRGRG